MRGGCCRNACKGLECCLPRLVSYLLLLFPLRRTKADAVGWAVVMASGKMQDINAAAVHR